MAADNHVKVYEITFNNPKNVNFNDLIDKLKLEVDDKSSIATNRGVFYIKEMKEENNSYMFLFGKDNYDASNYKRDKDVHVFEKIDINEDTEVLTDFIHISICKNGNASKHTLFMEKSTLITVYAFIDYINFVLDDALATTISRRMINNFIEQIKNANRILEITQTKKQQPLPIPNRKSFKNEEVSVSNSYTIKPSVRGGSITGKLFDKVFSTFDTMDTTSKFTVKISDSQNNIIPIDFDRVNAQYTIKYSIPLNDKTDILQAPIVEDMDYKMYLDYTGQI